MIWIVTGFPRSGTSMMMRALEAGGMDIDYSEEQEAKLQKEHKGGNPVYYELDEGAARDISFPLQHEGKVIKVLAPWRNLGNLAVHEYRVLFMMRDCREIATSLARLLGGALPKRDIDALNRYTHYINKGIQICANRMDVETISVAHYRDVLEDADTVFRTLSTRGWPMDPEAAAVTIDPTRYRTCFKGPHDVEPLKQLLKDMPPDKKRVVSPGG